MSKKIFNVKRLISVSLAVVIAFSSNAFVTNNTIKAARTGTGSAERYVLSSTAGDLKMNYPSEYPSDLLKKESEDVIKTKVEALLEELTLEEKLEMLSADGGNTVVDKTYGTGTWLGVGRVGIPVLRMYDGPMGVRGNSGYETTRPTNETSMASSFDKQMQYDYGVMYADEEYANAGNVQLGNQNDLIRRISRDRSRDMFSEDWYLSGVASYQMAKGLEDNNTISCLKHYVGVGNVDEQTLHENYLTPVEMSVKNGGASAVMTNYGTLNGVSACIDSYLLKDVLRNMWNFKGIVMTDWGGNYAFTTSAGVTMETPGGTYNNVTTLNNALLNGTLKQKDIDEMVSYNLYAFGHAGYLGLVTVDRYGVAVDDSKDFRKAGRAISRDDIIELPLITGDEREEMLEKNSEKAIEFAEKGAVLLKNENYNEKSALPLTSTENVAMIGFGSTYLLAGHMHECSFGSLRGLSVSPSDALKDLWPSANVQNYVTQDIVGEPVPADNLYQDATGEVKGVIRTGKNADGSTVADGTVDGNINFITNSTNYKNASNGTAFPAAADGTGVNYKWETYLEAPETGTYTIGVQGISWQTLSATMERSNKDVEGEVTSAALGSAMGNSGIGTFGSTSIVCTDSGLDVPTSNTQIYLEKGKRYKVTVNANATELSAEYQRGIKDSQIRLAWITPSQKASNYSDAVAAAGTADTSVVLFAHAMPETMGMAFDTIPNQTKTQPEMIDDMIAAAKAANNKVILVLSTGLPSHISKWADDPTVEAILQMWLPGQGGGTAIANLLSGKTSPSGKLALAWPKNTEGVKITGMFGGSSTTYVAIDDQASGNGGVDKTGRVTNPDNPASAPSFFANSTEIREGIFNGYKWYDSKDLDDKVLYDFGYGLSYTDFDYELVSVKANADGADDYGYDFTVKVTNTGTAKGSDAPQVYIGAADESLIDGDVYYSPDAVNNSWRYVGGNASDNYASAEYFPVIDGIQQAKYQLIGFERTKVLEPNESDTVTIHVDQRALSYWDVTISDDELLVRSDGTKHKYRVIEGERDFFIGKSSDNFVTVDGKTEVPVTVKAANVKEPTLYDGVKLVENSNGLVLGYHDDSDVTIIQKNDYSFKDMNGNGALDTYEDWRKSSTERAEDLASKMNLDEMLGLMFHDSVSSEQNIEEGKRFDLVRSYSSKTAMAEYNNQRQIWGEKSRLGIPLVLSTDPRHSGTIDAGYNAGEDTSLSQWPDTMGMSNTMRVDTFKKFGNVLSEEYRALGFTMLLGPQMDLITDPRWSRVSGALTEDYKLNSDLASAYIESMQTTSTKIKDYGLDSGWGAKSVSAIAKHWPSGGNGEFGYDSHWDIGKFGVYPGNGFQKAVESFAKGAGLNESTNSSKKASGIMPYYTISVDQDPSGDNVANGFSKYLVTDLLRENYDYEGLVCTDWQITGSDTSDSMPYTSWGLEAGKGYNMAYRFYKIIEAGCDQIGGTGNVAKLKEGFNILANGSESFGVTGVGEAAATARIRQSAVRILRTMINLGIFENAYTDPENAEKTAGKSEYVETAYEAHLDSIVMVKNSDSALPLKSTDNLTVYTPVEEEQSSGFPFPGFPGGSTEEEDPKYNSKVNLSLLQKYFNVPETIVKSDSEDIAMTATQKEDAAAAADIAIVKIDSPSIGMGTVGTAQNLQYDPYTSTTSREVSIGYDWYHEDGTLVQHNETPDPSKGDYKSNRSIFGKTGTDNSDQIAALRETIELMDNKPVIVILNMKNPTIVSEFENKVNAILVGSTVTDQAYLETIVGKHEPSGLLAVTMPKDMETVDASCEDIPDTVPYVDSDGHTYSFGYGLNWSGQISDERTARVSAEKEADEANTAKEEAELAKKAAEDAKAEAEKAKQIAEDAKAEAEKAKKAAEDAKAEAEKAKKAAEDDAATEKAKSEAAITAKAAAEEAKKAAEDAKIKAEEARKAEEAKVVAAEKAQKAIKDAADKALSASQKEIKKLKASNKKVTLNKVTRYGKKQIKVTWKKDGSVNGYQIQFSTNKSFKAASQKIITKSSITSVKTKSLKSKKTYYVRLRPYTTIDGKKVYGNYSEVKTIKVK